MPRKQIAWLKEKASKFIKLYTSYINNTLNSTVLVWIISALILVVGFIFSTPAQSYDFTENLKTSVINSKE